MMELPSSLMIFFRLIKTHNITIGVGVNTTIFKSQKRCFFIVSFYMKKLKELKKKMTFAKFWSTKRPENTQKIFFGFCLFI